MRARGGGRAGRDDGSVLVVMAVVMVLSVLVALGVGRVGAAVAARERAQTAADAAALAGLHGGRAEAVRVAHDNGAVLVGFVRRGWEVTVITRWGDVSARARASSGP